MAGPENWTNAPEGGRGGQYVTTPGFAALGQSSPTNSRTAPGSKIVWSPKGWRWEEAGDDYSKTISKLTAATMESAVRRIRTSMGEVSYIRGTADTVPPFSGQSVGDTCRVQDAQTLDIVAEWRWDGATWERMKVTSEQISNLDVGKLTAGSASIAEVTARKIASDVGRFLEITTDQLTVTGNASFVNATAHHVWTEIITAGQGEFEQIKAGMLAANSVSASNIQGGAIDGQVITGATLQTDRRPNVGLKIGTSGINLYSRGGERSMNIDANTGSITLRGNVGRSDSWSDCYFTDVVYSETGTDIGTDGARIGVGLGFMSKIDDWKDGTISMERNSGEEASIVIRSPEPRAWKDNVQPTLRIGHRGFAISTGYRNGRDDSSMHLSSGRFNVDIGKQSIHYSSREFGVFWNGSRVLHANGESAALYYSYAQIAGIWVHRANGLGFKWAGETKYWIDNDGFHIGGNKKFTMRVPQLSKKSGGMRLEHSATESPYDGVEYWENLTLDADGKHEWVLPNYVPKIASKKAPWAVFTNSSAKAELDRTNPDEWKVRISGAPGEQVSVLVKGARMIDKELGTDGEPIMRDYARESPWALPAPEASDGESDPSGGIMGGGYYGPTNKPKDRGSEDGR